MSLFHEIMSRKTAEMSRGHSRARTGSRDMSRVPTGVPSPLSRCPGVLVWSPGMTILTHLCAVFVGAILGAAAMVWLLFRDGLAEDEEAR